MLPETSNCSHHKSTTYQVTWRIDKTTATYHTRRDTHRTLNNVRWWKTPSGRVPNLLLWSYLCGKYAHEIDSAPACVCWTATLSRGQVDMSHFGKLLRTEIYSDRLVNPSRTLHGNARIYIQLYCKYVYIHLLYLRWTSLLRSTYKKGGRGGNIACMVQETASELSDVASGNKLWNQDTSFPKFVVAANIPASTRFCSDARLYCLLWNRVRQQLSTAFWGITWKLLTLQAAVFGRFFAGSKNGKLCCLIWVGIIHGQTLL